MSALGARLARLARDPLGHFMALALALFGLYALIAGPAEEPLDEARIVVDREALLTFLQYRSNAFQAEYFSRRLDEMTREQRSRLARDYVREEALHREAEALGLGHGDYVIRQRMIQKMQYVLERLESPPAPPTDAEVAAYFSAHSETYAAAPAVTLTHIFFDAEVHGEARAQALAAQLLAELNSSGATFHDAPQFGDRFPFFRNYVERTPDYLASQFGDAFLAALQALAPSQDTWQGPLPSRYGSHLVLLTHRQPQRIPSLAEVRGRVVDDLRRDRLAGALDLAIGEVVDRYVVEFVDDVEGVQ
jgi:hypothetical protein